MSDATDWKKESQTFDSVADFYDAYRPDYPDALIETIIAETGIPPNGKILEIGSGTGKATLLFARRGFSILCVEPGTKLSSNVKCLWYRVPTVRARTCGGGANSEG